MNWHHSVVRDLYWAINSPSLIDATELTHELSPDFTTGLTHWQDFSDAFIHQLEQLDQHPAPLLNWLADRLPPNRPPRLGLYFEALWHFYFDTHPNYQVIKHNLPIRTLNHQTLGELDLVVNDLSRDCVMHIELAVKFYLALKRFFQPMASVGDNLEAYIGPGLKDRLIDKYLHTLNHQLPLSTSEEVLNLGIHIDEKHAIFKGRLFRPWHLSNDSHYRWLPEKDLHLLPADNRYRILESTDWFAEKLMDTDISQLSLSAQLSAPLQKPRQVAMFDPSEGRELTRYFIVPDQWEVSAEASFEALAQAAAKRLNNQRPSE